MTQELYDREQMQRRLKCGPTKLNELTMAGEIQSVRIGRRRLYPESAVAAYIEKLIQAAKTGAPMGTGDAA